MEMVWEDPPAQARGRNKLLTEFINELHNNPKQWAKYPERRSYGWGYGVVSRHPGLECAIRNLEKIDKTKKSYSCDTYFRWMEEDKA